MDTSTFQGLREYYQLASKLFFTMNQEFEEYLDRKSDQLLAKLDLPLHTANAAIRSEWHFVEIQSVTVLRYAMLPRFLGLMERVLKAISKVADATGFHSVDSRDWLKGYVAFLSTKGVTFDSAKAKLESIRKLNILRNCIIHANGEIDASKNPKAVEDALDDELGCRLSDGFIFLNDQACIEAYDATLEVLSQVFAHFGYPVQTDRVP